MPDFLTSAFSNSPIAPLDVVVRLAMAMIFGGLVALVYRFTRPPAEVARTFTVTLVLLSILIAMVTQVIGDNIARAFSLVGALSIVRFRTVVRDTQDTAYVIFAVAVGMAIGADNPWVALGGIAVVGFAALLMRSRAAFVLRTSAPAAFEELPYTIHVRVGLGHDANALLAPVLETYVAARRLVTVATAKQGLAIEVTYKAALRREDSADAFVQAVNRLEGVQSVTLRQTDVDDDD